MAPAILDTDTLSEILKQRHPNVCKNARQYLRSHGQFAISAVTRFEIIRWYKELGAVRPLARFLTFCGQSWSLSVTDDLFDRAADLWVLARRGGHPCGDADLLIAATALEWNRRLITGNSAHFSWIPGLAIDNWRQA